MAELINYTIKELLTGAVEVDAQTYFTILTSLKPKPELHGVNLTPITEQPYKNIITIENLLKRVPERPYSKIEIAAVLFNIDTDIIDEVGIVEFYAAFNEIHNQYTALVERENRYLSYDPEPEEIEAGMESFQKFGRLMTVDAIAKGDLLKHEQVINLPYSRVFTKLYMERERSEFQRRYHQIKQRR